MYKSVILIGGPQKGTRFRPLSFDIPKPLFPVAGVPTIQHLIEACCKVPNMREILLIGFYQADEAIVQFAASMMKEYNINIRYLQEYTTLGTAGGMYHFRDQIRSGSPEAFFLINGDVCGNFPLLKMVEFHQNRPKNVLITVLGTEATRPQSQQYGCIVENKETHEIMHYVEKPSTFVSNIINCGVYVCSLDIFSHLASVFKQKQEDYYYGSTHFDTCSIGDPKVVKSVMPHQVQHSEWHAFNGASFPGLQSFGVWHRDEHLSEISGNGKDCIRLEQDILMPLAGTGQIFVYNSPRWWSQIKTAGSAIYANRHYLELYHETHPDWLACNGEKKPIIIGDVFIHPTATVHPTATLGPNVSIGKNAIIGAGVRIRESIVLGNATIQDHSLILHSIIGWNSTVGAWARVEGTPCDPNPNKPFAKMENVPLFNHNGRLNPSITVLGCNVQVPPEVIVLNSIVLPHKDLSQSYKNEIIL